MNCYPGSSSHVQSTLLHPRIPLFETTHIKSLLFFTSQFKTPASTMVLTKSSVTITHISTATAIISIDGINFLTDPVFCPAGSEYIYDGWSKAPNLHEWGFTGKPPTATLRSINGPAVQIHELPPIDAVLLSHEDHVDNLDPLGRQLLDGRRVFTTPDGEKNLQPRPGVVGLRPWQTVSANIGGKQFCITRTPCENRNTMSKLVIPDIGYFSSRV
ncbi:MBL fold metallo-hydrolase [Aspergillus chevalieri]|uniref:Metallo-beta-lactamase domain-containing protein n=1 Tax=Aspergillus chevalieri TaxID=182096 RepID=A0A7R7ZKI2_ASPCH|nr:uncharacterized protein ACHE_21248S [Aspergillus chevalieri]BCR85790.1 hypothetical protein ACHE_21248S [Aspergillus chevalieri]